MRHAAWKARGAWRRRTETREEGYVLKRSQKSSTRAAWSKLRQPKPRQLTTRSSSSGAEGAASYSVRSVLQMAAQRSASRPYQLALGSSRARCSSSSGAPRPGPSGRAWPAPERSGPSRANGSKCAGVTSSGERREGAREGAGGTSQNSRYSRRKPMFARGSPRPASTKEPAAAAARSRLPTGASDTLSCQSSGASSRTALALSLSTSPASACRGAGSSEARALAGSLRLARAAGAAPRAEAPRAEAGLGPAASPGGGGSPRSAACDACAAATSAAADACRSSSACLAWRRRSSASASPFSMCRLTAAERSPPAASSSTIASSGARPVTSDRACSGDSSPSPSKT
mmetsp:Transcript_35591/g.117118  ORF Transcript_35591/g.117118 Transcript_35591/m.117118 type:complete len:345 (-) Transcript_35591:440-1474(-)